MPSQLFVLHAETWPSPLEIVQQHDSRSIKKTIFACAPFILLSASFWFGHPPQGDPLQSGDPCMREGRNASEGLTALRRDTAAGSTAQWVYLLAGAIIRGCVNLAGAGKGRAARR